MNILDHEKAHQKFFEELTQIPHGSYHEQQYSDYLVNFAKAKQFSYIQDDMGNVVIYKPAHKGYENHEILILQAHMDMVCEKDNETEFDFAKDPLNLYIEDGWLKAKGTTLGADDGVGVAYMMAILDDDTIAHPPLECVFTVQEEVGLFGAMALKKEYFKGRRLINLDDGGEVSTCTTSAGGVNVILKRDIITIKTTLPSYRLEVRGLFGGHSGGEINKERGNANKIVGRVLNHLHQRSPIQIGSLHGGLMDNAIPREASGNFVSSLDFETLKAEVAQLEKKIGKELEFSDANVSIRLEKGSLSEVMSLQDSEAYLHMITLLQDGLHHHSMSIHGLSTASMNVGIVSFEKQSLMINCSIRGALESYVDSNAEEVELLAKLLGFQAERVARYPSWSYEATSHMRTILQRVCKERYNQELKLVAVHGGLECGVFKAMDEQMDIVTMGAIMKDIHTPKERLDLGSFDRTYAFLCEFLKNL